MAELWTLDDYLHCRCDRTDMGRPKPVQPAQATAQAAAPVRKFALNVLVDLAVNAKDERARIAAARALLAHPDAPTVPQALEPPQATYTQQDVAQLLNQLEAGVQAKIAEAVEAARPKPPPTPAAPAAPHTGMWDGPGTPARGPFRGHS